VVHKTNPNFISFSSRSGFKGDSILLSPMSKGVDNFLIKVGDRIYFVYYIWSNTDEVVKIMDCYLILVVGQWQEYFWTLAC
jgi:hypothetical protein